MKVTIDIVSSSNLIYLEWAGVLFNLFFVILIIKNKIWGWPLGVIGSLLGVAYFLHSDINMLNEAFLYSFYVIMGFYGWLTWFKTEKYDIQEWGRSRHIKALFIAFLLWLIFLKVGLFFGGDVPYADSFTTAFGITATFLEAKRVLKAWWYWIVLNAFSIGLYYYKNSYVYAVQMIVFLILSIIGYREWLKELKKVKE